MRGAARWASTANGGNPILQGGFQVVTDNGTDIVAFSAITKYFHPIKPSAWSIVGVRDSRSPIAQIASSSTDDCFGQPGGSDDFTIRVFDALGRLAYRCG